MQVGKNGRDACVAVSNFPVILYKSINFVTSSISQYCLSSEAPTGTNGVTVSDESGSCFCEIGMDDFKPLTNYSSTYIGDCLA